MGNIKTLIITTLIAVTVTVFLQSCLQEDKSKRPSPPATAFETIAGGNTITINYSRPSLKGRKLGSQLAPFDSVWRTGANEATTFQITKDANIQGKVLKAGKYSLYTIPAQNRWTVIFNKTWDQWGTEYNQALDVLRVQAIPQQAPEFVERMKFIVEKDGNVLLYWGDVLVPFKVN